MVSVIPFCLIQEIFQGAMRYDSFLQMKHRITEKNYKIFILLLKKCFDDFAKFARVIFLKQSANICKK